MIETAEESKKKLKRRPMVRTAMVVVSAVSNSVRTVGETKQNERTHADCCTYVCWETRGHIHSVKYSPWHSGSTGGMLDGSRSVAGNKEDKKTPEKETDETHGPRKRAANEALIVNTIPDPLGHGPDARGSKRKEDARSFKGAPKRDPH